jgi:hypothetical protein
MTDLDTPSAAPDKRRRFTHRAWWAGVAGGAAVLIAYLVISNATFTMHGTYTSATPGAWQFRLGDPCDYYTNPTRGSDVTITDHNGTIVGYGTLDQGTSVPGYRCEYSFTVEHVPYWGAPFLVKVDGVDPVAFDSGQASHPAVITP